MIATTNQTDQIIIPVTPDDLTPCQTLRQLKRQGILWRADRKRLHELQAAARSLALEIDALPANWPEVILIRQLPALNEVRRLTIALSEDVGLEE